MLLDAGELPFPCIWFLGASRSQRGFTFFTMLTYFLMTSLAEAPIFLPVGGGAGIGTLPSFSLRLKTEEKREREKYLDFLWWWGCAGCFLSSSSSMAELGREESQSFTEEKSLELPLELREVLESEEEEEEELE